MSEREHVIVQPLGGGQEVGRSCILLRCAGKVVLLDCGLHPGKFGAAALPLLEAINTQEIDLVLITHAHIDHIAGLPYLTERTPFRGKIYMTPPTRAIMSLLLRDYIRITNSATVEGMLYNEDDLDRCISKVNVINFHQSLIVDSIQFSCVNAGHILGACMFLIEFDVFSDTTVTDTSVVTYQAGSKNDSGSIRVLYTGDYSTEADIHLDPASTIQSKSIHVLIVESTFGANVFSSRNERESRLFGAIDKTIKRGGKCLIPMYAFGRAQELLLLLNNYWDENADRLQHVPILFVSGIAEKSLKLFKTFVNFLSCSIQFKLFYKQSIHPFHLNHVLIVDQNNKKRKYQQIMSKPKRRHDDGIDGGNDDNEEDVVSTMTSPSSPPCVIFASPGSLQSGTSRRIFEELCDDPKNSCIIAGYSIDGTLGRQVVTSSDVVINTSTGQVKRISCEIFHISFAAHVDCIQNVDFISSCHVSNIVLVHGELEGQLKLRRRLMLALGNESDVGESELAQVTQAQSKTVTAAVVPSSTSSSSVRIYTPENTQIVSFPFYKPIKAELKTNSSEAIFLESEQANVAVITTEDDLATYGLNRETVLERVVVKNLIPLEKLAVLLKKQFYLIDYHGKKKNDDDDDGDEEYIIVEDSLEIFVNHDDESEVVLEWELNPMIDVMADACVALILNLNCSPLFALALDYHHHHHDDRHEHNKDQQLRIRDKVKIMLSSSSSSYRLVDDDVGIQVYDDDSHGAALIKIDHDDDDLLVMPLPGFNGKDISNSIMKILSNIK